MERCPFRWFLMCLLWSLIPLVACAKDSSDGPLDDDIKVDERVIFFPTAGWKSADGATWNLPVRGWIFEPEEDSVSRDLITDLLASYFDDADLTEPRLERFRRRIRYFIVDNEGGKEITIRIAGERILLPESDGDGRFHEVLKLPVKQVKSHAENGTLTFRALPGTDHPEGPFQGTVHLFEPTGPLVISDIDDTMKVSQVTDRTELLKNTFLKPYKPVPGMPQTYRRWVRERNVNVLYVSNSPWQLYPPLSDFVEDTRFPDAPFDLLRVQIDDARLNNLFLEPEEKKMPRLRTYLQRFPLRSFILVGDSAENDPEMYGTLAREFPNRVRAILIRNVSGHGSDAERFQNAFRGIPASKWTVFTDPNTLRFPKK